MKQMLRKKDVWVLLAALIGAFACVTLIQFISGRIDGVASMVFLLAVFFVSMYTDGYWWGVAGSVISVLAVNFAFRTPYFAFNFTIPENIFSGVVMLVVSFMTSTLTTRIKKHLRVLLYGHRQLRLAGPGAEDKAPFRGLCRRPVAQPDGGEFALRHPHRRRRRRHPEDAHRAGRAGGYGAGAVPEAPAYRWK